MLENVLIICDVFELKLHVRNMLKGLTQNTTEISGGDSLKILKTAKPDLIICDQDGYPDGLILLSMLREHGINVPFILMASERTPEFLMKAKKAGITGFLGKPFSTQNLTNQVMRIFPETFK